jgi:hypothetical protein
MFVSYYEDKIPDPDITAVETETRFVMSPEELSCM